MSRHVILWTLLLFASIQLSGQPSVVTRVEPANWWVGMKNPFFQIIVYGKQIADRDVKIVYPGVVLKQVHRFENPNYLFLDLEIRDGADPGTFPISLTTTNEPDVEFLFTLLERNQAKNRNQGVTNRDFIYLIMPDRFSNGDPSNDIVWGMKENTLERDSMYYRHGGDLQGIIDHLDYLHDLGVTALWLNPVLENDQPTASYHGYANTENYKIDPRLGSNALYKELVEACHTRGMKVIMDVVHNHIGSEHWLLSDPPMANWIHQWDEYTKTNYREQVWMDPYVADVDKRRMTDGWFDTHMPDVNQSNDFVRNYITQSHIWWLEYTGLDGFRLDTYAYNDIGYMAEWAKRIKLEYPKVTFFGETWVHGVPNQAFFTGGQTLNQKTDTQLPGVTDFQALWGIYEALNGSFGWMDGVARLYNTMANDFVYEDATRNVVFLDNHDISRFYSVIGEDFDKFSSGITWLFTVRGIPQMYYGTEILMKNFSNPDGLVREDFPGGWEKDDVNKFNASGRTNEEKRAFQLVRTLANYRKNHPVLQTGKLMQYIPEGGVYVYFRYSDEDCVMVIMNSNDEEVILPSERFKERMSFFNHAINIVSGEKLLDIDRLMIPPRTTWALELQK